MEGKLEALYSNGVNGYDSQRDFSPLLPVLIRGMVAKNFEELSLLDVGSGTGMVAGRLLNDGIGRVTLMEPSESMMNFAQENLKNFKENERVFTKLAGLPNIDFEDCQFDVVMMLSCLHFADNKCPRGERRIPPIDKTADMYPGAFKSLQEALRVLKPGGIVILHYELPHQLRYGRWYAEYLPEDLAYGFSHVLNKEQMDHLLTRAGFVDIQDVVDMNGPPIGGDLPDNPLQVEDEEFRVWDSGFLFLTTLELENMLKRIREANDTGELKMVIEKTRERRKTFGGGTLFVGRKKVAEV